VGVRRVGGPSRAERPRDASNTSRGECSAERYAQTTQAPAALGLFDHALIWSHGQTSGGSSGGILVEQRRHAQRMLWMIAINSSG
jgi:hypothetical protein